jgi:uncharacterized repeat protein (TIGR03806 family)
LPSEADSIGLQRVFAGLTLYKITALAQIPNDQSQWWVSEQRGLISVFDAVDNVSSASVALDIRGSVGTSGNEMGLLGFAFPPDFASNGYIYVSYTAPGPVSRISRFKSSDGGSTFPANSEQILLSVAQPFENHNGGDLKFGPDGMLYATFGDGGNDSWIGDPSDNGQNPHTLLGSILRLDVSPAGATYDIPVDNPFADGVSGAPEVWAHGFRNPWRMSFDRSTGEVWAGDVGDSDYEEVNQVVKGGNYGWAVKEAEKCYRSTPCDDTGLIGPVVSYAHADYGNSQPLSVIGGYVYRGDVIPSLQGVYLFADVYSPGPIWGIAYDQSTGAASKKKLADANTNLTTFAEDNAGELYLAGFAGDIYKIVSASGGGGVTFPNKLSETGCFEANDPTTPTGGLVPFDVNQPLWSDNAQKRRWVALPEGTTAQVQSDGDIDFPVGTVLVKEFMLDGKRLETRLLVQHAQDEWKGYAYEWLANGSDALLVTDGATVNTAQGDWQIPNQGECVTCHTSAAGFSLGPELAQLNRTVLYPSTGRTANQITTWSSVGLFATDPGQSSGLAALATMAGNGSLEDKSRGYLHANCSNCHRPGSTAQTDLDLRWYRPFADTDSCNVDPDRGNLGVSGAKLIAPGASGKSIIPLRMRDTGQYRMPALGTTIVHDEAVDVIEAWVDSLQSCP